MDFELTEDLNNFDNKLFAEIMKTYRNKNIVYSPFCLETCLTMTRMGALGKTAYEMDKGLCLNTDIDETASNFRSILEDVNKYNNNLVIANKIYVNQKYGIQPKFHKLLMENFFSTVESINFDDYDIAAETINTWVKSKTNNLIKDIVTPAIFDNKPLNFTGLVLINAIHFKEDWQFPFPENCTREEDFYLNRSKKVRVQMMRRVSEDPFKYGVFPELSAAALEMPYKYSDLSMIIFLPDSRSGLHTLEQKLKTISLQDLKKRMYLSKVEVSVPKFKAEFEIDMKDLLIKKFGMKQMFKEQIAEFGNMLKLNPGEWLHVSNIIHKAFIEVNEKGTEAGAVARIVMQGGGYAPVVRTPLFIANRPFFYVIQNSYGVALFKGHVRTF